MSTARRIIEANVRPDNVDEPQREVAAANIATHTQTWINQFGRDWAVPEEVYRQFDDTSWGNDSAPTFTHRNSEVATVGGAGYVLWVDSLDPELSEQVFDHRFTITKRDAEGHEEKVFETDDVDEAVAKMRELENRHEDVTEEADEDGYDARSFANFHVLVNALLAGARTVGGLAREGIPDALKTAKQYPSMFTISKSASTPIISLIR